MPYKLINGVPKFYSDSKIRWSKAYRERRAKESYKKYGHWECFVGWTRTDRKTWIQKFMKKGHI